MQHLNMYNTSYRLVADALQYYFHVQIKAFSLSTVTAKLKALQFIYLSRKLPVVDVFVWHIIVHLFDSDCTPTRSICVKYQVVLKCD